VGEGCPVLMYHAVWDDSVPGGGQRDLTAAERAYAISAEELRRHLALARELGLRFVSIRDLRAARTDQLPRLVGLTFDDSLGHHARVAAPILSEHGAGATFFITIDELDRSDRLSRAEARGLADDGFELGGHGREHEFYSNLNGARVRVSLAAQKAYLAATDERGPHGLSLPGGRGLDRVRHLLEEADLAYVGTSEPWLFVDRGGPVDEIPRFAVLPDFDTRLRAILTRDAPVLEAQAARYRRNERVRRLLGDRGYAWLWKLLRS